MPHRLAAAVLAVAATTVTTIDAPTHREWVLVEMTVAYVGVPLNVLSMAIFGGFVAVIKNRVTDLWTLSSSFLYSVMFACAASAIIPELVPHFEWPSTGVQAIATWILAFTAQNWAPVIVDNAGPALKKFLSRFTSKDKGTD